MTGLALWSTPDGVDAALYHPQTGWQALDRAPDTAGTQVAAATAGRPPCRWAMVPLQLDPAPIRLSVELDNPGRVSSEPAAIDCPARCSADFIQEQTVVLTAAPVVGGGDFLGWSGSDGLNCGGNANPLTVKLTTVGLFGTDGLAQSCTAIFGAPGTATMATLTLTVNGGGHVSATGIDCGIDCSNPVAAGARLTLIAIPAAGYPNVVWGATPAAARASSWRKICTAPPALRCCRPRLH